MKHVDKKSPDQPQHWAHCERHRARYVEVADHGKDHCTVFYDVTNLPVDLDAVSDAMRRLYASYVEFCLLSQAEVDPFLDRPYLFQMLVRREHAGCFADTLFDYLQNATGPGI